MIDWILVVGFDWDDGNSRKSAEKHSVSQGEAEQVFFNEPLLLIPDHKHSDNEQRFHGLGRTEDERLLHVTFTLRDGGKLISTAIGRSTTLDALSLRDVFGDDEFCQDLIQNIPLSPNLRILTFGFGTDDSIEGKETLFTLILKRRRLCHDGDRKVKTSRNSNKFKSESQWRRIV